MRWSADNHKPHKKEDHKFSVCPINMSDISEIVSIIAEESEAMLVTISAWKKDSPNPNFPLTLSESFICTSKKIQNEVYGVDASSETAKTYLTNIFLLSLLSRRIVANLEKDFTNILGLDKKIMDAIYTLSEEMK